MSKSKERLLELNSKLAQTLTEKGVEATTDETTTSLVDKVAEISGNGSLYIVNCEVSSETNGNTEVINYDGDFTKIKEIISNRGKVELRTNFNGSNYILEPSNITENYVTFNTVSGRSNITIEITENGIEDVTYIDLNTTGSGASIDDNSTSVNTVWSSVKVRNELIALEEGMVTINDEVTSINNTWSSKKITNDYSTKEYVAEQIANASHLKREIVNIIPEADAAEENTIYMFKVESVLGDDKYQEWQLINGEMMLVGDTSIDLTGYAKINDETVDLETTWSSKKIEEGLSSAFDNLTEEQKNSLKGEKGANGVDGYSPTATVTQTDTGAVITITDENGTTTASVTNGVDGKDGANGTNGKDGVSCTHSWNGTTLTVTSASGTSSVNLKGDKGDTGAKGEQGIQGEKGENGSDYILTDTDKSEIATAVKADLTQLEPNFANSIDECTDTSKVYVLPDGYIYAYMSTEQKSYTNQLPLSTDTDDSVYNGTGYKTDTYLSSGNVATKSGYVTTGFIPVPDTATDYNGGHTVIRFQNTELDSSAYTRICFYDSNKAYLGLSYASNMTQGEQTTENKDTYLMGNDGYIKSIDVSDYCYYLKAAGKGTVAFIRLCGAGINNESIITVNEEISDTTEKKYTWTNTGHAFIPADYEERIIDAEEKIATNVQNIDVLKTKVNTLTTQMATESSAPDYVIAEAQRVAKQVCSHQNANTFTFFAISDMHQNFANEQIILSNIHAGQGMDLIRKYVNIDFAVCLGDNGWGSGIEGDSNRATLELGIAEIQSANSVIDSAFRGIPNFRTPGNHCNLAYNYEFNNNDYLDHTRLFPLYGAYNRGAVYPFGEKDRGYCYRDFEDWKLRVICMNSSDLKDVDPSNEADAYMSGTQMKWFAETIDLSSKADAAEWSVVIFSHIPLDYSTSNLVVKILKAYVEGSSVSLTKDSVTIEYDYANKNSAVIICNVHGHNHCLKVDYLREHIGNGVTSAISIKRICVPNACFTRSNERGENSSTDLWDIEYGEETSYEKVAETAEDTAFNVITVDPVMRKIYIDKYGAGYDREISY